MARIIGYGVDYSARRISGAALARHRYHDGRGGAHELGFVHRYLDFPRQGHPPLTRAELADLNAHGIAVEAIYEENIDDPRGGWLAGQRMGRQAVTSARAASLPAGSTIYFCADAWLSSQGITVAAAMAFLDGARTVIAEYIVGAYGFADFVFAAAAGGHADRFWLCGAEIPAHLVPDWLDAYQWNNGREYVDSVECDLIKRYRPIGRTATTSRGRGEDMPAGLFRNADDEDDDRIWCVSGDGRNCTKRHITIFAEALLWDRQKTPIEPVPWEWLRHIPDIDASQEASLARELNARIDGLTAAFMKLADGTDNPDEIKAAVLEAMAEGVVRVTVAIQNAVPADTAGEH